MTDDVWCIEAVAAAAASWLVIVHCSPAQVCHVAVCAAGAMCNVASQPAETS